MNHAVILDASVVVKIFIDEEYTDLATALIADSIAASRLVFAPLHFPSEVINAFHKHRMQGNITDLEANHALDRFLRLPISLVSSQSIYREAFGYVHQ